MSSILDMIGWCLLARLSVRIRIRYPLHQENIVLNILEHIRKIIHDAFFVFSRKCNYVIFGVLFWRIKGHIFFLIRKGISGNTTGSAEYAA